MLQLTIGPAEIFDEEAGCFRHMDTPVVTMLEHSLLSISKWESLTKEPFLSAAEKTPQQMLLYIQCMQVGKPIEKNVFDYLSSENLSAINEYINDPRSATTIHTMEQQNVSARKKVLTSEVIYSYMVSLNIPWECERWHLNRLLKLIKVCEIHQRGSEKMPSKSVLANQARLNAARRSQLGSRG